WRTRRAPKPRPDRFWPAPAVLRSWTGEPAPREFSFAPPNCAVAFSVTIQRLTLRQPISIFLSGCQSPMSNWCVTRDDARRRSSFGGIHFPASTSCCGMRAHSALCSRNRIQGGLRAYGRPLGHWPETAFEEMGPPTRANRGRPAACALLIQMTLADFTRIYPLHTTSGSTNQQPER